MTRTPTAQQVRDAIEVIRSSYTYDPPERWVNAHQLLRALRLALHEQLRPYRWIEIMGLVVAFVALLALIWGGTVAFLALSSRNVLMAAIVYATATLIPGAIIPGSRQLSRLVASRRHPLMALKDEVDLAAKRFEDRYAAEHRGQTYGAA